MDSLVSVSLADVLVEREKAVPVNIAFHGAILSLRRCRLLSTAVTLLRLAG